MFSEETKARMMADIQAAHPQARTAGPTAINWGQILAAIEAIIQILIPIFTKPPLT